MNAVADKTDKAHEISIDGRSSAPRMLVRPLTLQQAAGIAGVSPDTVARWCKRYGIGKQLHPKAPWRVDAEGLAAVAAGDAQALAMYHGNAALTMVAAISQERAL
jgi:hypothetical protein